MSEAEIGSQGGGGDGFARDFETVLIPFETEWTYWEPGLSNTESSAWPGIDEWTSLAFDGATYPTGTAGMGYGDDDDRTVVKRGVNLILLRREFELTDLPTSGGLLLRIDYDDGFVAYLNGQRILTVNAPEEGIHAESFARGEHEAGQPEQFDLSRHTSVLRRGKNVLAIAGLNLSRESSDLSIHPALGLTVPALHSGFPLKKSGDTLYLIGPGGEVADQVTYDKQITDCSWGRSSNTPSEWGYFWESTPGAENGAQPLQQPFGAPRFSPQPGIYPDGVRVSFQMAAEEPFVLRYTTDGRDPSASSQRYEGAVRVEEPTSFRVAAFLGTDRVSPIVAGTFWVGSRLEIPLLAFSLKPADFRVVHLEAEARGRSSERAAFWEYFDTNRKREIITGFGLRLHGGAGRNGSFRTKKSYRAYFRSAYGDGRLDGAVIPDAGVKSFDKVVLRANSNDKAPHGTSIRDQVIRDLHADMGGLAARGDWCVLLVNSEPRGVYNLTERMDEEFLASHLGPGKFDIIKTGETLLSGDREGWDALRRFVETTNLADQGSYDALAAQVDIENFTAYVIVNMCMQNFDWPHNNWYAARRVPKGRWIFMCWDSEWGLGYRHPHKGDAPTDIDLDPYAFMDSGGASGHSLIRKLFMALLSNPGYRDYYQAEVKRYLSGPLSSKNILGRVRGHRDRIAHDLEREYARHGQSLNSWYEKLESVEAFSQRCSADFQRFTDEYFAAIEIPAAEERLAVVETNDGRMRVLVRTETGELRQWWARGNRAEWRETSFAMPPTAPRVAGNPQAYSIADGKWGILYRGENGGLHELVCHESDTGSEKWVHTDLNRAVGIPRLESDPAVAALDGRVYCVFLDRESLPHEFWWDGDWHFESLPTAPRPGGSLGIRATSGSLVVSFRTRFGAPCVQRLPLGEVRGTSRPWRDEVILQVPALGTPATAIVAGRERSVFRPGLEWPLREPYVFHWDGPQGKGYQEYHGSRVGMIEASDQPRRFHRLQQMGTPPRSAAGDPLVLRGEDSRDSVVVYRDSAGHLQEASWVAGGDESESGEWRVLDLTEHSGAPEALSDPGGIVARADGSRNYVYRGRGGGLHLIRNPDAWQHVVIASDVR